MTDPHTAAPQPASASGLVPRRRSTSGFTLVEILVVISIIGILAGLAIPAITGAIVTARQTAIRVEMDVIGQALEAYKLQHGEYPPDFSDWNAVERHFRKAFSNIDDSELKLLAQFTWLNASLQRVPIATDVDPRAGSTYAYYRQCIDPAEALVFCLGGFSTDKKHPFTGAGGPLARISGATAPFNYTKYQYNTERSNGFMELKSDQLSLFVANDPSATPASANPAGAASGVAYTYSDDEYTTAISGSNLSDSYSVRGTGSPFAAIRFLLDPFPVYTVNEKAGPLVYFQSSGYTRTFTPPTLSGGWYGAATAFHPLNIYLHPSGDSENGVARPYLSNQPNTVAGGFMWANQGTFQLISAGLDGSYGGSVAAGVVDPADATTFGFAGVVAIYPTGQFANASGVPTGADKYEDSESIYGPLKPQLDNITNFANLTLEGDLP